MNKNWNDGLGGFLRFDSNGVFIDTDFSGTWVWEKNDTEPYIIKADYQTFEIWFEFTDVTEETLNFRASITGPDEGYNFEGLLEFTTD